MFTAEISDPKILSDSIQSIANVITEGVFQFNEDGVELVAADPAMVAMVDFRLDSAAFDSYTADGEDKVGINIEDLYSILRRSNSNDTITLSMNEEESKLTITMKSNTTRSFSLALLNLDDSDIPSTSNLEFARNAEMEASVLADAVGDASVVGDSVTISADDSELTISSSGDNSNVEFTITEGSDGLMALSGDGDAHSMFSLDYLAKMIKAKKLGSTVTLRMGQDFPMRIDFAVPETLDLSFILAPRIEED